MQGVSVQPENFNYNTDNNRQLKDFYYNTDVTTNFMNWAKLKLPNYQNLIMSLKENLMSTEEKRNYP